MKIPKEKLNKYLLKLTELSQQAVEPTDFTAAMEKVNKLHTILSEIYEDGHADGEASKYEELKKQGKLLNINLS